ncbi:putative glutathione S-transferase 5 [Holothuria leucospilota]|uniref:Glutathione S-transferase 5 n=1 Tax=Holothuria leucospilota TaxID=206669 RepID=A0A9Q1BHL2_HOLLE|nr:putative glutathione S-transferase 5 [Holothuria leucospilota]
MPTKYKLTYFAMPARAEVHRLTLAAAGADWEDIRVTNEQWGAMKGKSTSGTPFRFPWLPHLEVEGENIVVSQSMPALRFLARRFGLDGETDADKVMVESVLELYLDIFGAYGALYFTQKPAEDAKTFSEVLAKTGQFIETLLKSNSSGYIVGKKLTVADIAIYSVLREASNLLTAKAKASIDWSKLPLMKAHHEKIAKEPKVHAYYSK